MASTPTLVRVKRKITEEPTELFVLSAKRLKSSHSEENVKILKLAGTIHSEENLEETVSKIINGARKNVPNFAQLKERYKRNGQQKGVGDVAERSKQERAEERGQERYRLLSSKRAITVDELEDRGDEEKEAPTQAIYHLYDIVQEKAVKERPGRAAEEKLSCNGVEMIREYISTDQDKYVYDVYYTEGMEDATEDFDDSMLDSLVSLQPFNTGSEFFYDDYREDPSEFKYEDDEDSNEEDNERNEYPDEEEEYGSYCDDEDFDLDLGVGRLRVCALEDGEPSLSDGDEDQLLYTRSFEADADHHGTSYAKFKQRILREFHDDDLLDEDSEEDADI